MYNDADILSEIIFTFNTEAGYYTGEMPEKFSQELTIESALKLHGEPDQILENSYFHILDYIESKRFKLVFDRSNKKIYRIYFYDN